LVWSSRLEINTTRKSTPSASHSYICEHTGELIWIEKIKLRDEDSRQVTDKEIQILSALSHKHIVRYFNCWTEDPIASTHEETEELVAPAVDEISDPFAPPDPKNPYAFNRESSKSLSFPPVRFSLATRRQDESSSDESDTDSSDADSGEETESERPKVKEKIAGVVARISPSDVPSSAVTGTSNSDPAAYRTLYIAMEFVDNVSLGF
jgi:translation initiation factor 2-alpha kinase 4